MNCIYRFSKGDMDAVKRDLETEFERFTKSDLSSKSVEENWNEFKTTLMSSIKNTSLRKHWVLEKMFHG